MPPPLTTTWPECASGVLHVSLQVFPDPIQSSYVSLYLLVFAMQSSLRSVHDKRIMTMNVLVLDCTFIYEIYEISSRDLLLLESFQGKNRRIQKRE